MGLFVSWHSEKHRFGESSLTDSVVRTSPFTIAAHRRHSLIVGCNYRKQSSFQTHVNQACSNRSQEWKQVINTILLEGFLFYFITIINTYAYGSMYVYVYTYIWVCVCSYIYFHVIQLICLSSLLLYCHEFHSQIILCRCYNNVYNVQVEVEQIKSVFCCHFVFCFLCSSSLQIPAYGKYV